MLRVSNLYKSYGAETILSGISFIVNAGDRLGLVGPNGCGKTTLLRLLAGQETPDTGGVQFDPPGLRIGYLPQGFEIPGEETLQRFLLRMEGDLPELTGQLEVLAAKLASYAGHTDLPGYLELERDYDAVLAQVEMAAQSAQHIPETLDGLGLGHLPLELPAGKLSGGQKTRLALAGVLLSSPQLLLLDEPTNHLDLEMLEWLESWMTHPPVSINTGVLMVSHDRAFLDHSATGILELDPGTHTLRAYTGNYSRFLEQKLAERERRWQAYTDQQEEIARLRGAAAAVRARARFRKGGKADTNDKFAKGFFANRSLETIRRAKQLEARLEKLLNEDTIEKPRQTWEMKLDFGAAPASGKDVLALEGLTVGYRGIGDKGLSFDPPIPYPLSLDSTDLVLLHGLNLHVRQGARVGLVGPNGAGKTTLLRTIAGILPPLAGKVRLGANVRLGYMAQEQEDLDPNLDAFTTIQKLAPLSETEARSFLHYFLFSGDEVFTPVGKLSFGERARLSLACLVASGCNLLLLDEPVNHLDIPSRSRFEQALAAFRGTTLAVVHDRYFLSGFATEIWETVDGGIQRHLMD